MLRIKLVRSPIAAPKRLRATITALGLRKVQQEKELPDTPSVRGMIFKVKEMLEITVPEGTPAMTDARSTKRGGFNPKKRTTPQMGHRKH
jgi:large subunit ribosomal protein L30